MGALRELGLLFSLLSPDEYDKRVTLADWIEVGIELVESI